MNFDLEKTKIIDGLTDARDAAAAMKQELLLYLIEVALAEARSVLHSEQKNSSSSGAVQ